MGTQEKSTAKRVMRLALGLILSAALMLHMGTAVEAKPRFMHSHEPHEKTQGSGRRSIFSLPAVFAQPQGGQPLSLFRRQPRRRSLMVSTSRCDTNPDSQLTSAEVDGAMEPLAWQPERGRYLFPMCEFGRISNQMDCMRRYFWMAAFLNRTLVLPREGYAGKPWYDYRWRWDAMLDTARMRTCLRKCCSSGAAPAIMTLEEYLATEKRPCIHVDRHFALHSWAEVTITDRYARLGVCPFQGSLQRLPERGAWAKDDLLAAMGDLSGVPVVSMGSIYSLQLFGYDMGRKAAPFAMHGDCGALWFPHIKVLDFVSRILKAHVSEHGTYASMHWRRGDFKNLPTIPKAAFLTVREVAKDVSQWLSPLNVSVLYVASDGSEEELKELERLLQDGNNRRKVRIVTLKMITPHLHKLEGVEGVKELEIGTGAVITATIEKYLCAHAKAFLGTPMSTFSGDISRIRLANHWASCRDSQLWSGAGIAKK